MRLVCSPLCAPLRVLLAPSACRLDESMESSAMIEKELEQEMEQVLSGVLTERIARSRYSVSSALTRHPHLQPARQATHTKCLCWFV